MKNCAGGGMECTLRGIFQSKALESQEKFAAGQGTDGGVGDLPCAAPRTSSRFS